jgi:Stanniocalcin family
MINTMHCLQMALVPEAIDSNATTCSALQMQAFGTHAECYVSNGLCSLGVSNWVAIIKIVDLKTLFNSWDAFKATAQAAGDCVKFITFVVANHTESELSSVLQVSHE